MAHEVQWPKTLQRTELVNLSFFGFAFWWVILLTMHLVTCAYCLAYAKLYWAFEQTVFSYILRYHEMGISSRHNRTICYVFMALAAAHGICVLLMIVGSLWHRKLVFLPRKKIRPSSSKIIHVTSPANLGASQPETEVSSRTASVVRFLSSTYHRIGSEHGFLGVKGEHFHVILICREVLEVALQTAQAIRMSRYLPRLLLNRFYVSLLAINCCSSVLVYSRWFSHDEARRRFAALLCDCVLNLMTTIGVSLIIMLRYSDAYDIDHFNLQLLQDDEWVAQTLNETRVVLVESWPDLAARIIFSLSLVATTTDMKSLLDHPPERNEQAGNAAGSSQTLTENLQSIGLQDKLSTAKEPTTNTTPRKNIQLVGRKSFYKGTGLQSQRKRRILQGIHVLFALWGIVILALHIHASKQTPLQACAPQVYPMAGALPSCYAVQFNCHTLGFSATKDELEAEWHRFDRTTAVKLCILHCPSVEMPASFQDFISLQEITVYNSTILDWDDATAMTTTHHPKLRQISVVRANMTGGSLPLGFQSRDFPVLLNQFCFSETNVAVLPDHLTWPLRSSITLESSKLATIPSSLTELQPYYLELTGSSLTDIPAEVFEAGVEYLSMGNTGIQELPRNVLPTTFSTLDITNTNISFFPAWIDSLIEVTMEMEPMIVAGGSAYCLDLDKIMNGESTSFSASFDPDHSSVLMNASEANWELLYQIVDCSPPLWTTQYWLDYFDSLYARGQDDEALM